jgi:hypothetical protein
MQYSFYITPDGKLPIGIKETLARIIPTFANKKVRLALEEAKEKRSLDQNALYWGVVIPLVRQFRLDQGDPVTDEQAHDDLLAEFAPRVATKKLDGTTELLPLRSRKMNVTQMATYITAIEGRLSQFGIHLPADRGNL